MTPLLGLFLLLSAGSADPPTRRSAVLQTDPPPSDRPSDRTSDPPPVRYLPRLSYSEADPSLQDSLNCSAYVLHDEFLLMDNGSVFLPGLDVTVDEGRYVLLNGTAVVCPQDGQDSPDITEYPGDFSREFLMCGHFFLDAQEFVLKDDGRVYVDIYEKTYGPKDFYMVNGGVYICMPEFEDLKKNASSNRTFADDYFNKFPDSFSYLTYTGLLVSILCLLSHLFVFCTVSSVRNLPGHCLASLSLSLLMAYLCFMAISVVDKEHCLGLGLCVYYFFLSAFFWMNAIAFDVWRSFRVVVRELRLSSHRVPWRRLLVYSLYSWAVPAALTILVRVGDSIEFLPKEYRPDFGHAYCWFGRRTSLLVFFAVPLVCVMLLNAGFFLDVTYVISRASLKTSHSHEATLRKRFFMFMRLALIMGLTWIVGLVAGFADNFILWYVFIALNTLQGLFIFVVFSCGSKVRQLFFKRCRQKNKHHRGSTSVRTISQVSAAV